MPALGAGIHAFLSSAPQGEYVAVKSCQSVKPGDIDGCGGDIARRDFNRSRNSSSSVVMPGLGPGIHAFSSSAPQGVDARTKCGHDG